jgi:hypothetical protein
MIELWSYPIPIGTSESANGAQQNGTLIARYDSVYCSSGFLENVDSLGIHRFAFSGTTIWLEKVWYHDYSYIYFERKRVSDKIFQILSTPYLNKKNDYKPKWPVKSKTVIPDFPTYEIYAPTMGDRRLKPILLFRNEIPDSIVIEYMYYKELDYKKSSIIGKITYKRRMNES